MRGPRRLSQKLILSLTVVVSLVVVANGLIAVRSADTQLQATMLLSVEQLSGAIASSTWHAMLADQRESVRLFDALAAAVEPALRTAFAGYLDYARRHLEIIERFGRFPHRNAALGRETSPAEAEFLRQPGSRF